MRKVSDAKRIGPPDLSEERKLSVSGVYRIAGLDEVGRGAWAGPLIAAAVVLPLPKQANDSVAWDELTERLAGVNDSKQLSPARRELLLETILQIAEVGLGIVSALSIDLIGVGVANKLAMVRAVAALPTPPQHLLIDAFSLPLLALPQTPLIKGDARCLSIAAASIVAKVSRDRLLVELDSSCPGYDFARHKGYGTAHHQAALEKYGPGPAHRYSYKPVWEVFEKKARSFEE